MNSLRPYQNDLVEQLRTAWREGYKAPCIVLPCGGGNGADVVSAPASAAPAALSDSDDDYPF